MSDATEHLERTAAKYESVADTVEDHGYESLAGVRSAHEEILALFDRYEDRATDWDDFEGYVEFQDHLVEFIDGLSESLPEYEAFTAADEALEQRNLSSSDFDRARRALEPAATLTEVIDRYDSLAAEYRSAYHEVERERRSVADRISHLQQLQSYADLDLDRSTEPVHGPIASYNDAIQSEFQQFRETTPSHELLGWLDATTAYPLVQFEQPPDRLRTYLSTTPVGDEPIPTLLTYAEYSRSKLAHYVEDPQALLGAIGSSRTYLEWLSAEPLELAWPPAAPAVLRYRIDELISVIDAFASAETIAQLRSIRQLTRTERYATLRRVAIANDRLDDDDRRRLQSGAIERELAAAIERRDTLQATLDAHEPP